MTNETKTSPTVCGTIKALEWEDLGADYWSAPAPLFGKIRIEPWGDRGFQVLWSVPGVCDRLIADLSPSPEAAKSAAQADYNARILAAIQPDGEPEPVDLPHDGTCMTCGCAPRNAEGLCATCADEYADPVAGDAVSGEAVAALKPLFGDPVMEGLLWSDATPESLVTIRVQKQVYDRARAALRSLGGETA